MVQQCLHITSKMDQQNGGDDGTCQLEFLARQRKKCFKKAGIQSSRLSPSSLTIADLQGFDFVPPSSLGWYLEPTWGWWCRIRQTHPCTTLCLEKTL